MQTGIYRIKSTFNIILYRYLNLILIDTDYTLRRISEEKPFNYTSKVPYFSYEIEYSLVKLFERELEIVKNLNYLIKDLSIRYDYNTYKLFSQMDEYNLSYLTAEK